MTSFGTGPLLAVDAPALLYRAFFGVPKSIRNNALLGTTNTLLAVSAAHAPRAIVICFGNESAEYRVKAYPPYHANRPPMPPELEAQFDLATDFFRAFGWMVEHHDTLEADDLVHSFAQIEAEAGGHALILTGDRDLYQSVNARVHVLMMQKGGVPPARVDEKGVYDRYGVRPDQVPDFIALRGDPSDSLPGAKGIGEKSARDLLHAHHTLENVIANAAKPSASAAVRAIPAQADMLRVFRDVATCRRIDLARPGDTPLNRDAAAKAARAKELGRLADRLAAGT
ncbi:MAG: 5'-3' exonuclease [Polyangiaceae bacterium]